MPVTAADDGDTLVALAGGTTLWKYDMGNRGAEEEAVVEMDLVRYGRRNGSKYFMAVSQSYHHIMPYITLRVWSRSLRARNC